ncbi:MAG: hypothetical protein U5L95_02155 [Candidatus Saccharibacteria bacterium]|nr:hypothetical protein [Candidatus Saccharibacteria bacterium]
MEFDSEEIDPELLVVSNNGECESKTGHTRIKIWCEAEPTHMFGNFLDAVTNGIENLEIVLTSKEPEARYELVFPAHFNDVHRMHRIAEQFILEVNNRVRVQDYEMLRKFLYGSDEQAVAMFAHGDPDDHS